MDIANNEAPRTEHRSHFALDGVMIHTEVMAYNNIPILFANAATFVDMDVVIQRLAAHHNYREADALVFIFKPAQNSDIVSLFIASSKFVPLDDHEKHVIRDILRDEFKCKDTDEIGMNNSIVVQSFSYHDVKEMLTKLLGQYSEVVMSL